MFSKETRLLNKFQIIYLVEAARREVCGEIYWYRKPRKRGANLVEHSIHSKTPVDECVRMARGLWEANIDSSVGDASKISDDWGYPITEQDLSKFQFEDECFAYDQIVWATKEYGRNCLNALGWNQSEARLFTLTLYRNARTRMSI